MKKKELIKIIAEEFDLDEIKVTEYFDNIFETLAVTFFKNKNVNISEFGKFKVKTKLNEDGEKQKTVLFSPVKKFAYDVNYNFNELSPIQIRILDDKKISEKAAEYEYPEDEAEEIILIDFEDEKVPETSLPDETLIPEETQQDILHEEITAKEKIKEDLLIPEETRQEILHEEMTAKEKITEKILIPEITAREELDNVILEEVKEEVKDEVVPELTPVVTESTEKPEIAEEAKIFEQEQSRIYEELLLAGISPIEQFEYKDEIEYPELIYADKKIVSEATTIIIPEERKEEIIPEIPEIMEEDIKEETISDIPEVIEENSDEEQFTEEISAQIETSESKEEISDISEIIEEIEKDEIKEPPKTNLELEAELLKMLEERKKILDEIKNLESTEMEDLIEIPDYKISMPEQEPNLFDEDMLDKPKQNVFVDENGKIFENLLQNFDEQKDLTEHKEEIAEEQKEHVGEEEIIPETKNIIPETEEKKDEELKQEIGEEKSTEFTGEDFKPKESTDENEYKAIKDDAELDNLFGFIYGDYDEKTEPAEIKEGVTPWNSPEMQVFDKLLDDTVKENTNAPLPGEEIIQEEKESVEKPENVFVNFKTEKTSSDKKDKATITEKTETIKTYDDIFSLLEPNGKKKEIKLEKSTEEKPPEKFPPVLKLIIPIIILIVVVIISVYLYQKSVYKPSEENPQTQVTPSDSTKISGKDSIIYADTNKTEEAIEENTVYDESGYVIKENEKGFFVHFGNFENQFELAKKIKELKAKNIPVNYEEVKIDEKQTYKVIAGPYKSLTLAKAVIPKL